MPIFEPRYEKNGFLQLRKQRRNKLHSNCAVNQCLCFRYMDSKIPLLSIFEISSLLAIICGCTDRFVSDLVGNTEDRFSHNEAHLLQENGFYVECGAYNGETFSNSLFFEKYRNWSGVLIEPHPDSYKVLRSKHRKAFSINACLSRNSSAAKVICYIYQHLFRAIPEIIIFGGGLKKAFFSTTPSTE